MFNSALQLGSAVGAALISSIQATIDDSSQTDDEYKGRAIGFWLLLAFVVADTIAVILLYKPDSKTVGTRPWDKKPETREESIEVVEHNAEKDGFVGEKKQTGAGSEVGSSASSPKLDADSPPHSDDLTGAGDASAKTEH